MENWEEGWERLLDEALQQLQKSSERIQDAWKGVYGAGNPYANHNSDSAGGSGGDRSQPGVTSRVYGEEPVRRRTPNRSESADSGTKSMSSGGSQENKPTRNSAGSRSGRKGGNKNLPARLNQLLEKIRRDAPYTYVDYRFERNPLYQLNYYDESYHFYDQAVFMADYEDDCPYEGEVGQIFWPTYQKLDVAQLRGYFTWRTKVRRVYEAERAATAHEAVAQKETEQKAEQETPQEAVSSAAKAGKRKLPRSQVIADAPLCYQYLYVYEILNQVGVDSPEDGYQRLKYIEANLKGKKNGILPHLKEWLFDYVVYYQLDRGLLSETEYVKKDHALSILLDMEDHTPEEVFDAAAVLSTYNVSNSKYVREHPKQYREVLYHVLMQMVSYYEKNRKVGFWEGLFGLSYTQGYEMFNGALFYDRCAGQAGQPGQPQEFHYWVDELCCFEYVHGRWRCDGYSQLRRNATLGQIMCAVDAELRTQYQYESSIRNTLEIKYLNAIVTREVRRQWKEDEKQKKQEALLAKAEERKRKQEELEQKRQEAEQKRLEEERLRQEEERKAREVVLDFGKLDEIRKAAEITQQRLLAEESEGTELMQAMWDRAKEQTADTELKRCQNPEPGYGAKDTVDADAAEKSPQQEENRNDEITVNGIILTEAEAYILRSLLEGTDYKAYFQSHHLMSSLVVESLNEKLYDEIGDIVIEFDGEEAVLVEDYIDDVRAIVAQDSNR